MKIEVGKTYLDYYHNKFRIVSIDGLKDREVVGVCDDQAILRTFTLDGVSPYEAQTLVSEFDPWTEVKVDTPIWVRDHSDDQWQSRHFAAYFDGEVYAWSDGQTSHTSGYETGKKMSDFTTSWKLTTLVNPNKVEGK